MTPLRGADGRSTRIAQGNLVVSGFGAEANDGSQVTVNVPSAGRMPNGATVERAAQSVRGSGDALVLNLNTPDFTTAARAHGAHQRRARRRYVADARCDLGPGAGARRTRTSASPSSRGSRTSRSSRATRPRASS